MTGVNPKTGDEPLSRVCADDAALLGARVFKTMADPFVGKLSHDEDHRPAF